MKTIYSAIVVAFLLISSTASGEIIGQLTGVYDIGRTRNQMVIWAPDPLAPVASYKGGPFLWDITSTSMEPGWDDMTNDDFATLGGRVVSFCIDPIQPVESPLNIEREPWLAPTPELDATEDPNGAYPMGPIKFAAMKELWAEHFNEAKHGGLAGDAFQLALWEILFEKEIPFEEFDDSSTTELWNVDWEEGDFYLSGYTNNTTDLINQTNSWLADIDGNYGELAEPTLWAWTSPDNQDHLVQLVTVPEPTLLIQFAGFAALFGLAALRRRWLGRRA